MKFTQLSLYRKFVNQQKTSTNIPRLQRSAVKLFPKYKVKVKCKQLILKLLFKRLVPSAKGLKTDDKRKRACRLSFNKNDSACLLSSLDFT